MNLKRNPTNKRRAPKKSSSSRPGRRTAQLAVVLALLLVGILMRAFVLQALRNQPLRKMAEEQYFSRSRSTSAARRNLRSHG